jgi:hypothetical protein
MCLLNSTFYSVSSAIVFDITEYNMFSYVCIIFKFLLGHLPEAQVMTILPLIRVSIAKKFHKKM